MYDLIGDIHGHADALEALLRKLGYTPRAGRFHHPTRKVIFVGDFIDRGPKIREVLQIVRPMVDEGSALAVMGNHEFNAIAYATPDPAAPGEFLRRHTPVKTRQHEETLRQIPELAERERIIEWFYSLPLWLELPGLRVVHACWDESLMGAVQAKLGGRMLSAANLVAACKKGDPLHSALEVTLKGKELSLPAGCGFFDKDGHERREMRIRWYRSSDGQTLHSYALPTQPNVPEIQLSELGVAMEGYPSNAVPVFFGHYWLNASAPETLASNVCCLDYSVAKGGFLCAYRWEGEQALKNYSFVTV